MGASQQPQIAARKLARHYAVQATYQWLMTATPSHEIEAQFLTDYQDKEFDREFFHALLSGVVRDAQSLNEQIAGAIDRALEELDVVEKALLLVGSLELAEHLEVPYKVVINEHVNLAKKFGATDSHKYINGVLDQLATGLRPTETASQRKP